MIVTFTPPDGEARVYTFDPDTFPYPDSERVEELTGMLWEEAKAAIIKGGAKARRALAYCFERRAHPSLSWASFGDFPSSAIKVEFTKDEIEKMSAAAMTTPGLTEAEKVIVKEQFSAMLEDAPEAPKAPVPSGESST